MTAVFACAVDDKPVYQQQALRLIASLRWFGGSLADARFVAGSPVPLPADFVEKAGRLGAEIVPLPRFDARHGHSNKISLLGLEALDDADTVVVLDCDTLIVGDAADWLNFDGVSAKPADLPTVSLEQLRQLHDLAGLEAPEARYFNDVSETPTIHYVNSGVVVVARAYRRQLYESWAHYGLWVIENAARSGISQYFSDQASLALAITAAGIPFAPLPTALNMPLHLAAEQYPAAFWQIDPVILHYHDLTDASGYLRPSPFPRANVWIEAFNARRRAGQVAARPQLPIAKPPSTAARPKVVVGTGWWSAAEKHAWEIGSNLTRRPAFFHLWYGQVMKSIGPEKIIVTDSASPDRPEWQVYGNVEFVSLDRNYGHANDIRVGKIATRWSGFTRSVINGAVYAMCCDADYYVYVEQDCLLRGGDLVSSATEGVAGDIFLGQPTRDGVGLDGGTAAAMLQQSLMIVKKAGLERFVTGLLSASWTDGDLPPEETMRRVLQPIAEIAIPYGRSRPIDFSLSTFYAQHLSETELQEFAQAEQLSLLG